MGNDALVIDDGTLPIKKKNLRKQFLPNLVSNGVVFVLNILIGLWFTTYLIQNLGIATYGLVPLVVSFNSYVHLINLSLNGASGRYLTIDFERGDVASANRTFNTVLFGNIGLIVLALPIIFLIVVNVPNWFDVPSGQETLAQWLFATTLIAYLINVVRSSFSVSAWAQNRFDLQNSVVAIYNLARVLIVVLLFVVTKPVLWHVGLGFLGASILALIGDVLLWHWLTPQLKIQPFSFDRKRIKQLFGMGGWLIINQVGSLLILNVDVIIVNTMIGARASGEYGALLQFSIVLRNFAHVIASVLTPSFLTKYACGNLPSVNRLSKLAVKFMGIGMALPIGLLCGLSKPLLMNWLGPEFLHLSGLLIVLLFHLSLNLSIQPLFGLNITFNRVRVPGMVTLGLGFINIITAIAFVKIGWGFFGVAIAGAIIFTIKNAIFISIYGATIQKMPWWTFLLHMFRVVVLTALVWGLSYFLAMNFNIDSWIKLGLLGSLISLVYLGIIYFFVLSSEERIQLLSFVPKYFAIGLR